MTPEQDDRLLFLLSDISCAVRTLTVSVDGIQVMLDALGQVATHHALVAVAQLTEHVGTSQVGGYLEAAGATIDKLEAGEFETVD